MLIALYCWIGLALAALDCLVCIHDDVERPTAAQSIGLALAWPAAVVAGLALLVMVLVIEVGIWLMGDA